MAWTTVFLAASLLFCRPFVSLGTLDATPDWGDARLIAWTLAWHARWPVTGAHPLDAPLFAPEPAALANSEPMLALGLAVAPVTALAGPFAAFNVLRLLLPVVNALAMAWLVWHYLRDGWAALIAGFALGFAYSQIATVYLGLVQLAALPGLALAPLWLDRWWDSRRARHLGAAVAAAVAQALVSWYAAVLVVAVLLVQLAWLLTISRDTLRATLARLGALTAAAGVAGALLWPLARPVMGMPPPSVEELRSFSLQPSYYTQPPLDTWAGARFSGNGPTPAAWDYRRSYFPGFTAGAAALAGALAAFVLPHRRLLWAVWAGVIGYALSLGPSGPGTGWRPFDLLTAVPGVMAFRAPGRMAVLVAFAVALLAGLAVHVTPLRYRRGLAVLLLAGFLAEGVMVYRPRQPAAALPRPHVFARLAEDSPRIALVVPMLSDTPDWPSEADYLLFAQPSWTPIANGYGRRTPSIYEALRDTLTPRPRGSLGEVLRFYGISHVVVLPRYHPVRAADFAALADASDDFEKIVAGDSEGNSLYRVRPSLAVGR